MAGGRLRATLSWEAVTIAQGEPSRAAMLINAPKLITVILPVRRALAANLTTAGPSHSKGLDGGLSSRVRLDR
jgi:hypothetical protein